MPYNDPYGYGGNTAYAPPPPMGRHGGVYPPQPDIYGGGRYDDMAMSRHGRDHDHGSRSRSRNKHSGSRHSSRHRGRRDESSDESSQSSSGSSVDSASTGATSMSSYLPSLRGSRKSRSRHDKRSKKSSRSSHYSESESESPSESEYSESEDEDRKRKARSQAMKGSGHSGRRNPLDNVTGGARLLHGAYDAIRGARGKRPNRASPFVDLATALGGFLNNAVGRSGAGMKKRKPKKVKGRDGRERSRR